MPWDKFKTGNRTCVYNLDADGNKTGDALHCYTGDTADDDADKYMAALHANVDELASQDNGEAVEPVIETVAGGEIVTEFGGAFPDVPLKPGLNLADLTSDDPDPFFVTLELSRVGATSKNGLLHDDDLGAALVEQVNGGALTGIMGHIPANERKTSYPTPSVYWVGAIQQGGKVWGKGYIPPGKADAREHFKTLKRVGGRAATSIYGAAVKESVDKTRGVWRLRELNLEQIDLAPYERAALAPQSDFTITAEMQDADITATTSEADVEVVITETTNTDTESTTMEITRDQVIAELTAQEIPAAVKEAIIAEYTAANEQTTQIAELEGKVEAANARVEELTGERDKLAEQVAEFHKAAFQGTVNAKIAEYLNWDVTGDDAKAKLEALRKNMRRAVLAELGDATDEEKLGEVVTELWDGEFQSLAETMRDALAGPAAIVGGKGKSQDIRVQLEELYSDPAKQAEAAAMLGVGGIN